MGLVNYGEWQLSYGALRILVTQKFGSDIRGDEFASLMQNGVDESHLLSSGEMNLNRIYHFSG